MEQEDDDEELVDEQVMSDDEELIQIQGRIKNKKKSCATQPNVGLNDAAEVGKAVEGYHRDYLDSSNESRFL